MRLVTALFGAGSSINLGGNVTFDFEKFSQSMAAKGLPIKNAKLDKEQRESRLKTMRSINERWNHSKLSTKK